MENNNAVPYSLLTPIPWFRKMQKENPVFYDRESTLFNGSKGAWFLFGYQDVAQVLLDYSTYSSAYIPKTEDTLLGDVLVFKDPPEHTQLRRVMGKALGPYLMTYLEAFVEEHTYKLMEPWMAKGEMDFIGDFSAQLPIWTSMKVLGIKEEYFHVLKDLSCKILTNPALTGDYEAFFNVQKEGKQFVQEIIREHELVPQDDFTGLLLKSKIDDRPLLLHETISLCFAVMLGGVDTTVAFLGNVMRALVTYPEMQAHLMQQPDDLPKFLDETLRFYPPLFSFSRMAAKDITVRGQLIHKGDIVVPWLGATNFDDTVFPDPDVFDINRKNMGQILNFGRGVHYCPGESITKMEARVAFRCILQQAKHFQLQKDTTLSLGPSTTTNCLNSLPITFVRNDS
ncbi:cytochrome P450 [Chitinophaga nivalis]|uniref:Cytochrome P450 n=1 Tax=Chitinophaga nivalis TaxID=2991709 RepID=A0ABT3ISA5_9BACT|nr:cytochrome P450 [Chitinophaga nivalis]MCW3463539.1 cytochrome P450 [Chitinophaga nivalis]MCW3486771.1 cytochrome P450 [Chitinophaga nivalis]